MVSFIGAGPGDPELLTIKGKRLIDSADIIIYAGSLVNPQVLADAKADARIYNSAGMTLEEVLAVMQEGEAAGKKVVRVHTGDPAIYGAHREQMDALEYTLPGVSQTVILTRMEGRTPMPEGEKLLDLARHQATMVIFLSAGMMGELCATLRQAYRSDTPAAVVYKATWEDERIVRGTLTDLPEKVEQAGIRKTALTVVGDFLGNDYELSRLYDKTFTHEFRKGVEP